MTTTTTPQTYKPTTRAPKRRPQARPTHLGHRSDEPLVSGAIRGASAGASTAPLPHVVPAAAIAARLRYPVRAGAALPAVGALEEAEGSLDALLVVTAVSAVLVEMAASSFALYFVLGGGRGGIGERGRKARGEGVN